MLSRIRLYSGCIPEIQTYRAREFSRTTPSFSRGRFRQMRAFPILRELFVAGGPQSPDFGRRNSREFFSSSLAATNSWRFVCAHALTSAPAASVA